LYLSKTEYGAVCNTDAEAGQGKQQKAAQQHQKNSQTLGKHSCEPHKQQKLFSEPRLALPEPQKL
jgi:hypothetical protein